MREMLAILAVLACLPAGAAFADDDDDCFAPMADWQPRDAVVQLAQRQGWTVRRIKIDDGCYELDGTDAAGRPFEVTLHPATLQVLEIEHEDGEGGDGRGDHRADSDGEEAQD